MAGSKTSAERLAAVERALDNGLDWWAGLVIRREAKGVAAAARVVHDALDAMEKLSRLDAEAVTSEPAVINLHFMDRPQTSGIFNAGTGRSQSFNDVAVAVVRHCQGSSAGLEDLVSKGSIRYVDFPPELEGRYQSYTEASIEKLRRAGYDGEFSDVDAGVRAYVEFLRVPIQK